MVNFHFIKDPQALAVIDEILELVGPNFTAPYDADAQPSDGVKRNDESLTQFDIPGGITIKSVQNTQINPSMGFVISSLLTILSPIISAYGFLLPILGIIKAIIEILCCLMNPYCIIGAVIRLFEKYLPPFISLFPPSAGIVLIKSVIKLILALVYYVMTEIAPTIQLIIDNVKKIVSAFDSNPVNLASAEIGKQKILTIITDLSNRIGLLSVLKPILELIFLLLQLISGIPCGSGEASSESMPMLGVFAPSVFGGVGSLFNTSLPDTNCCNTSQCPEELAVPPRGTGMVARTSYGDDIPNFSWQLIPLTGQTNVPKLRQYLQNLKSQLDPQLDEPVSIAAPIGSRYDASHLRVRITGRRDQIICLEHAGDTNVNITGESFPITDIQDNGVIVFRGLSGVVLRGMVDYCIEPNFEQLIANSIIGVGCHPRVIAAKDKIRNQFGEIMEQSALNRFPELVGFDTRYNELYKKLQNYINGIRNIVDKPIEDFDSGDGPAIQSIQDNILSDLLDYSKDLISVLNVIVSRMSDGVMSFLEIDKNIARAGGSDFAIIRITPRDVSGTAIMKNMRDNVVLDVQIFTDFGTIKNKRFDISTGSTIAEISSPLPGTSSITAKVGDKMILAQYGSSDLKTETVRFVADAVLPKRRHRQKSTTDIEPGNR